MNERSIPASVSNQTTVYCNLNEAVSTHRAGMMISIRENDTIYSISSSASGKAKEVKWYVSKPTHATSISTASQFLSYPRDGPLAYLVKTCKELFIRTFLPVGYPQSVRAEYLQYQFWDSLQGISSYLRSVLTTKALLVGAGVGSLEANPLTSALIWISRDGIGMIGSLLLAYFCANAFEVNFKEWRLFADFLNNFALTLDLLTAYVPTSWYFVVIAMSTLAKSCCWLIAGATKARISSYFAVNGCVADITAKESTQETGIALVGLTVGMICAKVIDNNISLTWVVFVALLILHQWANYRLIKVLVLDSFNPQRIYLVVKQSLMTDATNHPRMQQITPHDIACQESLMMPIYLWWVGPKLGTRLDDLLQAITLVTQQQHHKEEQILQSPLHVWATLTAAWSDEQFIVGYDKNSRIIICLSQIATEKDVLKSYFISLYLMLVQHNLQKSLSALYVDLLGSRAAQAKRWFDTTVVPLLQSGLWDCSEHCTRLGEIVWKYSMDTKTS